MLTAPFKEWDLEKIATFASKSGIEGLEVVVSPTGGHIDVEKVLGGSAGEVLRTVKEKGVRITSLAFYSGRILLEKSDQQFFKKAVEACTMLDVDVLCCLAGMPSPGKSKKETLRTDFKEVYTELAEFAGSHGVRLAMENWYATLLQGLDNFDLAFEMVPNKNLGLNFDPSHLVHQQIDYVEAVYHLGDRIFHTHAKDTEILDHRMHYVGIYEGGWWRYRIPGRGQINWNASITALKDVGYDFVLSIEHEDSFFDKEAGFRDGARYLNSILF